MPCSRAVRGPPTDSQAATAETAPLSQTTNTSLPGWDKGIPVSAALGDALLDELTAEPSRAEPGPLVRGLRYTHDAMVDLLIAEPWISQNELALRFGFSPSWISTVICSDAFQAKLAERREEIVDPRLRATLEEQFRGVLARSMEIIREKLNQPASGVPDQLALRSLELSSRALGYGAREAPMVQVNVDAHLEDLGGRLTTLLQRKKAEVVDQPPWSFPGVSPREPADRPGSGAPPNIGVSRGDDDDEAT